MAHVLLGIQDGAWPEIMVIISSVAWSAGTTNSVENVPDNPPHRPCDAMREGLAPVTKRDNERRRIA